MAGVLAAAAKTPAGRTLATVPGQQDIPSGPAVPDGRPGNELQGESGNAQGVAGNNAWAAARGLPPIGGAAAPAVQNPDYAALFRQAAQVSQAGVGRQFQLALEQIGQHEANANAALGLLPGQLKTIYSQAQQGTQQAANTLDAAQQAAGLHSFITAGAQMQPLQAAVAQNQAAELANVPVLGLGLQSAFGAQRSAVEQAQAAAEAQAAQAAAAQRTGYTHDLAMFQLQQAAAQQQNQQAIQQHLGDQAFTAGQNQLNRDQSLNDFLLQQQYAQAKPDDMGVTPAQLTSYRQSPEETGLLRAIADPTIAKANGVPGGSEGDRIAYIYQQIANQPVVLDALLADSPQFAAWMKTQIVPSLGK